MTEVIKFEHGDIIESQVQRIANFLQELGLPSDNIIAANSEREIIGKNLPDYIYSLPQEVKQDARYLSKFVVGAGFGLFDYALNSIWNEVCIALRNKAIMYGLEIFFDAAVGGKMRDLYKAEDQLADLKDAVMLDTCKRLELITSTTHKKLAHILDMRNNIGISHPTNYTINAFELLGWLQTSIKDVLMDQPSEAAIQIKAFIDNLKDLQDVIDESALATIKPKIESLASHHCARILRTVFGMYVDNKATSVLRKNIALLVPILWENSGDDVKYKLGIILEGYNNNLHKDKYERGNEFFDLARGNKFRTANEREVILDSLVNELVDKHNGWDNFYNEVPIAERIMTFVEKQSDIPQKVSGDLVHAIVLCRVGKGTSYRTGVSPEGRKYYDQFISLLGDDYVGAFIVALLQPDVTRAMYSDIAMKHLIETIKNLRKNIINERAQECLDYLVKELPKSDRVIFSDHFKKISAPFVKWRKDQ
jgi:hypothetical protein